MSAAASVIPAVEQGASTSALAIVHLCRLRGRRCPCGGFKFQCVPCSAVTLTFWDSIADAGDAARRHLAVAHGITPIPRSTP